MFISRSSSVLYDESLPPTPVLSPHSDQEDDTDQPPQSPSSVTSSTPPCSQPSPQPGRLVRENCDAYGSTSAASSTTALGKRSRLPDSDDSKPESAEDETAYTAAAAAAAAFTSSAASYEDSHYHASKKSRKDIPDATAVVASSSFTARAVLLRCIPAAEAEVASRIPTTDLLLSLLPDESGMLSFVNKCKRIAQAKGVRPSALMLSLEGAHMRYRARSNNTSPEGYSTFIALLNNIQTDTDDWS